MPLFRTGHIRTFKCTKKGFITVEAAIFLPIFIVGVLTYAYLIKFMAIQELAFHSFIDEARALSSEVAINPSAPLFFESKLEKRINSENGNDISNLSLDNPLYLFANGSMGTMSMDLNYDVNIKLPIPFYKNMPVSESIIFRGFIGNEVYGNPMPFEEMQKEHKSKLVWVLERAGEKYHKENCTYITSKPRLMVMSRAIRNRYKACKICKSSTLMDGNMVYCFSTYGEAYHTRKCPLVDKIVVSMEKDEAVNRGYTPCSKCGGE